MSAPFHHVVVMGVAGSGKTTLGNALAAALGAHFVDADDHHPLANREKMKRGVPLTDEDRWPWLAALASLLEDASRRGERIVLACSALKSTYRDVLRRDTPGDVAFLFLDVPRAVLEARLVHRSDHFFDPRLLTSQLDTLELPSGDEAIRLAVRADDTPASLLARALAALNS